MFSPFRCFLLAAKHLDGVSQIPFLLYVEDSQSLSLPSPTFRWKLHERSDFTHNDGFLAPRQNANFKIVLTNFISQWTSFDHL